MLSLFHQCNADADVEVDQKVIVLKYVLKQNFCLNLVVSESKALWLVHALLTKVRIVAKKNTSKMTLVKYLFCKISI